MATVSMVLCVTERHVRRVVPLALILCLCVCSPHTSAAQDSHTSAMEDDISHTTAEWNRVGSSEKTANTSSTLPRTEVDESLGNKDNDNVGFGSEAEAEAEAVAKAEAEAESERVGGGGAPGDATNQNDVNPEVTGAPELEEEQAPQAADDRPKDRDREIPNVGAMIPLVPSDVEAESEISLDSLVDPVIVCMRISKPFVFRMECETEEIIYPPATLSLEEFRLHFQGLDVDLLQALKV